MKLRTKVFTIFVILAILPLIIITWFSYDRYVQTINQRMDEISTTLFENAVENTNNTLDVIRQTSGLFTFYSDGNFSIVDVLNQFADPDAVHSDYDVFEANRNIRFVCQNVLFSYDYIYGLYVFTPSGDVLGHTSGQNGDIAYGLNPVNESWYKDTLALDGGLYVSSVDKHSLFTGTFSGKKESIFFSQALYDVYSHEFLGVLVIDCDPSVFDLSLYNSMPDVTMLTLADTATGNVLYTNADSFDDNFARRNQVVMQEDLNVEPLRLTAVLDYDTLFQEYNMTGLMMLLIALVCGVGVIILAYIVSKNMVYPIEHLGRKMAVQRGHTLETTGRYLSRPDEIGTLYNEYNAMVEQLNTSIKRDYEDKLVLLDAQMKSLEARINSHFLFNTLEAINSMAELEDNEQIATMSLALGNMFRYTIKTQSELVPLSDELEHVNDYVSIQRIRFDNRFTLVVDVDDDLLNHGVLKLILQPLVENSLYHGLNYCTTGDTIKITGKLSPSLILISVEDNGTGMEPEQLEELRKKLDEEASFTELGHRNKQSIGLKNIHSRIELYYGKGYGLHVDSEKGKGTTIQIKLPNLNAKGDK